MAFPIKVCVICSEEFELRPDKPGYANRCPSCSVEEVEEATTSSHVKVDERLAEMEMNASRRKAIRDLLYSGDN